MKKPESAPTMSRSDVFELQKRCLADFIANPPQKNEAGQYRFRITSGTTGGSKPLFCVQQLRPEYFMYPDEPYRLLVGTQSRLTRLAQVIHCRQGSSNGQSILVFDANDLRPSFAEHVRAFETTEIRGFPSGILKAAEHISPKQRERIYRVSMNGEFLSSFLSDRFRVFFPNARQVQDYGLAEMGVLTKESCRFAEPNVFHPLLGVTIEIDSPDADGVGEILASKPLFREHMIRRYRTGDTGVFSPGPCACGEKTTFRVIGRRGYDSIKLATIQFHVQELDRVIEILKDDVSDYRADVTEIADGTTVRAKLTISIFKAGKIFSAKDLVHIQNVFEDNLFVTLNLTAKQAMDRGLMLPVEIVPHTQLWTQKDKNVRLSLRRE